jgi:uncharacterized protein
MPLSFELETPHGPARVHLHPAAGRAKGALMLGHGAGGGVEAPDLVAATQAANGAGWTVALVEQPYRVAGKKSQPAAKTIDAAWEAVAERLRGNELKGLDLIAGGRSAGARVACRTSEATGAVAVLCLAFPVHPPGKADDPSKSRLYELEEVKVPVLVIQGEKDSFGMPTEGEGREIVRVPGSHSLRTTAPISEAVSSWLTSFSFS